MTGPFHIITSVEAGKAVGSLPFLARTWVFDKIVRIEDGGVQSPRQRDALKNRHANHTRKIGMRPPAVRRCIGTRLQWQPLKLLVRGVHHLQHISRLIFCCFYGNAIRATNGKRTNILGRVAESLREPLFRLVKVPFEIGNESARQHNFRRLVDVPVRVGDDRDRVDVFFRTNDADDAFAEFGDPSRNGVFQFAVGELHSIVGQRGDDAALSLGSSDSKSEMRDEPDKIATRFGCRGSGFARPLRRILGIKPQLLDLPGGVAKRVPNQNARNKRDNHTYDSQRGPIVVMASTLRKALRWRST
jgi:hypothetical protein